MAVSPERRNATGLRKATAAGQRLARGRLGGRPNAAAFGQSQTLLLLALVQVRSSGLLLLSLLLLEGEVILI